MFLQLFTFLSVILAINAQCAPDCSLWMRCSPWTSTASTVWALADNSCVLFKTSCLSAAENCKRVAQCHNSLVITNQQDCQSKCPNCANVPVDEVCGWFPDVDSNGGHIEEYITFQNECELRRFSCTSGRANHYPQNGQCT